MLNRTELASLVRELAQSLAEDPHGLLDHFSGEPEAAEIRLIYSPPASALAEHKRQREQGLSEEAETASSKPASEVPSHHPKPSETEFSAEMPANFRCTLCSDRMYPVRRFYRKGRLPVLVAHHSGGFGNGVPKRDLSQKFILGSREEDELFLRMMGAVGYKLEDLHYQEYVACHFNPERSIAEDWTERGENCLNHLRDTIEREQIRLLLLTGPAAVILLSEEKAKEHSVSGEPLLLELGPNGGKIPVLPIRSPAALLALEAKRKAAQSAGDRDAYKRLLEQEKRIKEQIVASLKRAFFVLTSS